MHRSELLSLSHITQQFPSRKTITLLKLKKKKFTALLPLRKASTSSLTERHRRYSASKSRYNTLLSLVTGLFSPPLTRGTIYNRTQRTIKPTDNCAARMHKPRGIAVHMLPIRDRDAMHRSRLRVHDSGLYAACNWRTQATGNTATVDPWFTCTVI